MYLQKNFRRKYLRELLNFKWNIRAIIETMFKMTQTHTSITHTTLADIQNSKPPYTSQDLGREIPFPARKNSLRTRVNRTDGTSNHEIVRIILVSSLKRTEVFRRAFLIHKNILRISVTQSV